MNTRMRNAGTTLMRSGLVALTAGAMMLSLGSPASAAENTGDFSTFAAVGISQPSTHPQGAQNVTVAVTGKQVTVNWDRSKSHRGEYRVAVFQGSRIVVASYHLEGPVTIDPNRLQTGVTYYVSVAPMRDDFDIIPNSSVLSDNFVLSDPTSDTPSPSEPGTGNPDNSGEATPGQPGEPGSDGHNPGATNPVVQPPTVPTGLRLRLDVKNSTGLELFWFEPDKGEPITNYQIELVGDDHSTSTQNANMQAELPEYMQYANLKPGVSYQAKVRAENSAGWGPWSEYTEKVTIPADQEAFKMQIDPEGFGAFVHPNRDKVTISWTQTGYEPMGAVYLIRVQCVRDCGDTKSRIESFNARGHNTNWVIDNLRPGVYKAQLKLVNGDKFSETVESEPFTIGVPLEITDPHLKINPVTMIDPTKENIFTVSGTGYRGESAAAGVYVVVAEESVWAPGKTPKFNEVSRFTAAKHIKDFQIVDGTFTTTLSVPANVFDSTKKYYVGTMAAHALSITDRKLDAGESLVFLGQGPTKPGVLPENPSEHPTQPPVTPGQPSDGTTPGTQPTPGEQPTPGTEPSTGGTETPGSEPGSQPSEGTGRVNIVLSQGEERLEALTAGKAMLVDVTIAGVPDGGTYRVVLHSNPVDLGEITLNNNRAQLDISEAEAARMIAGEHTLKFYNVNDREAQPLELPIRVNAAPVAPNADTNEADNSQPPVDAKPAITVTPNQDVDPAAANSFTVTGTNFVGEAAQNGIYVVVADETAWTAGKNPAGVKFVGQAWVQPDQITDGSFTTTVTVPANTFDPAKKYVVGTMAAHRLAITNRSLDTAVPLAFATPADAGTADSAQPDTGKDDVNKPVDTTLNLGKSPAYQKQMDPQTKPDGKPAPTAGNANSKLPATGAGLTHITLLSLLLLAGGAAALRTRTKLG